MSRCLSSLKQPVVYEERIGSITATSSTAHLTQSVMAQLADAYMDSVEVSLIPFDRELWRRVIPNHLKANSLVVTLFFNDSPAGFLVAGQAHSEISLANVIQQMWYHSSLSGVAAVKAVWAAHRVMLQYAAANKYDIAVSICSPEDPGFKFNKILAKDDWQTRGHTSVYFIKDLKWQP